jgi:phage/plasmid-associated DNA primase
MKFAINLDHEIFQKSIFCNAKPFEVVNPLALNGFIKNNMGIKFHKQGKFKHMEYANEQVLIQKYFSKFIDGKIPVEYFMSGHKWGRVNPKGSLSLSLFHRPTRHSLCEDYYTDFDMVNAQPSLINQVCLQNGIENKSCIEYCKDPKGMRYAVAKHHDLKNIVNKETGVTLTPYEQAKKLFLILSFGGSYTEWKKTYNAKNGDLDNIIAMEAENKVVMDIIYKLNPRMLSDANNASDAFKNKSETEKKRSIMALWGQSMERMIQERCILSLCENLKFDLDAIVPCQDGFMILKTELERVGYTTVADHAVILKGMSNEIKRIWGFDIDWEVKPFNEGIKGGIPLSNDVALVEVVTLVEVEEVEINKYIPFDVITKGIGKLAPLMATHLKNKLVYCNEQFYECDNKNNLWYVVKEPTYTLTKLISECLDYTVASISNKILTSDDEKEKEDLRSKRDSYTAKYIKWCGKGEITLLKDNLKYLIRDNEFAKKLNKTSGKFVFKNGILDFRTNLFKKGIDAKDYITFTTSHIYDPDTSKRDKQKEEYLLGVMKKICNNCDEDLEYLLSVIGYALTGCSSLEKSLWYLIDGTEGALGDNGKSLIFAFLTETIPEYVMKTTAGFLEARNTKVHKQLCGMKSKRIVWADEGTTNKVNDELLKVIPDGRTIDNEVMFGTTEIIDITFKLFCCSNNKTNIGEGQNAVFNRYNEIPFKSHFDRSGERIVENTEKLLFIAKVGLGDELIKNYCDSFFYILMDYALKYFKSGLAPKSASVLKATNATKMANDEFITWFNNNFETGVDYKCSRREIEKLKPEYFKTTVEIRKFNKNMKDKLGFEYTKGLKGLGDYGVYDEVIKQMVRKYIIGGYVGFRLIKEEETDEIVEPENEL